MRGGMILLAALPPLLAGCATSSVVLLDDEKGGHGKIAVLDPAGSDSEQVIGDSNTRTRLNGASGTTRPLGTRNLTAREAETLAFLPPPPVSFTLYFYEGTTRLAPGSEEVLTALRQQVEARSGAEVQVTGHTDTLGSDDDNDALSLSRAKAIAAFLVEKGFDPSEITTVGRGERDLRVQTGDGVRNSANRRVEVIVR